MRKAHDFVDEYRRKGYPDDRIRIIASMRPEPLRSEVLQVLSEGPDPTADEQAPEPVAATPAAGEESPPETGSADELPEPVESEPAKEPVVAEKTPDPAEETPEEKPVAEKKPVAPRAKGKVEQAADKRALAAAAKEKEKLVAAHEKEIASLKKERDALKVSLDKQLAALKKEQENLAGDLKKKETEVEALRSESGKAKELEKKVGQLGPLQDEIETLRAEREGLVAARDELEARSKELEEFVSQRESLLSEKDDKITSLDTALAEERAGHKAAISQSGELAATVEKQAGKLRDFETVQEQVAEFSEAVSELKEEAERLKETEEAKAGRIVELETDVTRAQEEAGELQEQIAANEQALTDLQDTLTSRESELESLRSHFDLEAKDLKKRAEQEVRLMQRRVKRVHKLAAMGAAIAACVVIVLFIGFIDARVTNSGLRTRIATGEAPGSPGIDAGGRDTQVPPQDQVAGDPPRTDGTVTPPNVRRGPGVLPANIDRNSEPAIGGGTTERTTGPVAPTRRVIKHTVKKGDKLWNIAEKHLGAGSKWKQIARENRISLTRPMIREGMVLTITIEE